MTKEQTNSWEEELKQDFRPVYGTIRDNCNADDISEWWLKRFSQEKEKWVEEIKKVYVGYYDRTEGRDDSYDDAFLDGTEVMQKKILDLLQNK